MREQEIRNILIEYIKMNSSEVRIYQEKGYIADQIAQCGEEADKLKRARAEAEAALKLNSNYARLLEDAKADLKKLMQMARMKNLVE